MSLSKPVVPTTAGNSINFRNPFSGIGYTPESWATADWPKWTIVAAVGVPVLILGAGAGYYYWTKSSTSPCASTKKKETSSKDKENAATSTTTEADAAKPAHLRLKEAGNAHFKTNNYAQALESYNAAIDEKPSAPELATLYQNRAAVFEKLKDWAQVERECTAALKLNPKYVKALHRRAKAYKETGFLSEALEDVTAVCILESFGHQSSIQLADTLLQEIGAQQADKMMKVKKPMEPSPHAVASFMRSFHQDPVSVIWSGGDVDEEVEVNGEAGVNGENGQSEAELNSNSGGDQVVLKGYKLAEAKLRKHEIDQIIKLCTDEISIPDSKYLPLAYLMRGTFLFLGGREAEAVEDYNAVLKCTGVSNTVKSAALVKSAIYYSYLPDDSEHQKLYSTCFDEAERLSPKNPDLFHQRGQAYLMKGQIDDAIAQIQRSAEVAPEFALAPASKIYLNFRMACLNGDPSGTDEAIREFSKCVRNFPTCPDIFGLYGQMLLEMERLQEARLQFDKVIELEPNNVTAIVHRTMLEYRISNDGKAALEALKETLKLDEKNEFLYETIGNLSLQVGELEEAVKAFTQAMQCAKTHQEMVMLASLRQAAEVQIKVKQRLGMTGPPNFGPV